MQRQQHHQLQSSFFRIFIHPIHLSDFFSRIASTFAAMRLILLNVVRTNCMINGCILTTIQKHRIKVEHNYSAIFNERF